VDGITGYSLSYQSAFDQYRRFGSALTKGGFRKGDVMAIHLPNCAQYMTAALGTIGICFFIKNILI
jgi:4-coumarate--CoA ligase